MFLYQVQRNWVLTSLKSDLSLSTSLLVLWQEKVTNSICTCTINVIIFWGTYFSAELLPGNTTYSVASDFTYWGAGKLTRVTKLRLVLNFYFLIWLARKWHEFSGTITERTKTKLERSCHTNLFLTNILLFPFPARKTYESFTEEKFVEYMARATLPEEEFIRHREAIRELLHT